MLCGRFDEVAKLYRLIKKDAISILVPYGPMKHEFDTLAEEAGKRGLTAEWIRRAAPLTVSLYRPREDAPVWERLEQVRVTRHAESDDWFIYRQPPGVQDYDEVLGLVPPDAQALWIG